MVLLSLRIDRAHVYRIEPIGLDRESVGCFAKFTHEEMLAAHALRRP